MQDIKIQYHTQAFISLSVRIRKIVFFGEMKKNHTHTTDSLSMIHAPWTREL